MWPWDSESMQSVGNNLFPITVEGQRGANELTSITLEFSEWRR
jgi:hypothetical protein